MNLFSRKIKQIKDRKELKKSNFGRDYGWFIEFNGKIIGELIDHKYGENGWDSYKLVTKFDSYERVLFDPESWIQVKFKLRNKKYKKENSDFLPGGFVCDYFQKNKRIDMKYLWIDKI